MFHFFGQRENERNRPVDDKVGVHVLDSPDQLLEKTFGFREQKVASHLAHQHLDVMLQEFEHQENTFLIMKVITIVVIIIIIKKEKSSLVSNRESHHNFFFFFLPVEIVPSDDLLGFNDVGVLGVEKDFDFTEGYDREALLSACLV